MLYEYSCCPPQLQTQQDDLPGNNQAVHNDNIRPETFYITMKPYREGPEQKGRFQKMMGDLSNNTNTFKTDKMHFVDFAMIAEPLEHALVERNAVKPFVRTSIFQVEIVTQAQDFHPSNIKRKTLLNRRAACPLFGYFYCINRPRTVPAESDYYDVVAADYDRLFDEVISNKIVRRSVQEYFTSRVQDAVVMDFGGGTGLDLPWLLEISRKIYFCEPSSKMREIAMARVNNHPSQGKIVFIEEESSDISNWEIPFPDKMDACLANFAVLNNIRTPGAAFEKLALVIKSGGDLILNVLDARWGMLMRRYPIEFLRSFLSKEVVTHTKYRGVTQTVYLHSPTKLAMSADPYFELQGSLPLKAFGFMLLHLRRR